MKEELSKYEQALAKEQAVVSRKKPGHVESDLQIRCVKWFAYQYQHLRPLLFAVPNGGRRDARTGAILKAEGVHAGVSDLLLLYPSRKYHGLCIEMKKKDGYQRPSQKEWQEAVEEQGYKYIVCRTIDDFIEEVNEYMNN